MANNFRGSKSKLVTEPSEQIFQTWVKQQNYIYIGERPIVDHLMYEDYIRITDPNIPGSDKCKFVITTWPVITRPRAFAYTKDFIYYELFDTM